MRWFSNGWVIGVKSWTANSYIAYILAKDRGLWKGISRSKRPMLGSYVYASWSAKDISALGTFNIEIVSEAAEVINDPKRSHMLLAACEALILWCNERDPEIYPIFMDFIRGKFCFTDLLKDILNTVWAVPIDRDDMILEAARHLELPRLPMGYHIIRRKLQDHSRK